MLATAIVMNELGRRSVRNGTGKFYGHNHQGEFRTTYADPVTGEVKSAWQILVENTDPRYVTFELDVLWATDGGADPVALLKRYGSRIKMLHIKDGINVAAPANATPVPMGQGEMDFAPILAGRQAPRRLLLLRAGPAVRRSDVRPVRQRAGRPRVPRLLPVLTTAAAAGSALTESVRRSSAVTHDVSSADFCLTRGRSCG